MRVYLGPLFGLFLCVWPVHATQELPKNVVLDLWDAAYLQGGKVGFVRTTTSLVERNGQKLLRTTQELHLTVKRFSDTIQLRAWTGTEETEEGKIVGVFMRQQLGQNKQLNIVGSVVGNELRLTLDGKHALKPAPWDDRVIGLYRQQRLFKDKKVKPGDRFSYLSFEPTVNLVVQTHVAVKDHEEVTTPGGKEKQRLLRVEVSPEKIEDVQLPTIVYWLDAEFSPVQSQVEVPGLGKMVLHRGTRATVLATGPVATLTDIGISQLLRINKRLTRPYESTRAVYRVTVKGDDNPASTFAHDERQQIGKPKGDSFEIHVRASHQPKKGLNDTKADEEFLQSSYFINCADAKVKQLARQAVGTEKDPWQRALRIEKWVHDHMSVKNHESLATADHVARTLEGDCTEFAMLTAAMCRAEGVPSRTAIGLIYADTQQGPVMAFHMWTEVWVRGQWMALDATLGKGYVGATHLKITHHSWHETRTLNPLLPVLRVLGKTSIEVLECQ